MFISHTFSRTIRQRLMAAAGVSLCVGLIGPSTPQTASNWSLPAERNFPSVNGNVANQRYSSLTKITPSNVNTLGGAWLTHLEDGRPSASQAAPIVVDGVMYVTTGLQTVIALDAATGVVKWKYHYKGAGKNRGVAVAEGKVFFARFDNTLAALDQDTGPVAWEITLSDQPGAYTSAAPVYYGGIVYIGIAGSENGVRGQMGAYDAKTGREVWKIYTVPAPGERGGETWEGESYKHGGAGIWTSPAIDPDLGMIYLPVGNAAPDNDGTARGGDNLFANSILAVDLKTGAHKWHFQEVHHDLWDYDTGSSPLLADITYRGQRRNVLIHAGKTGFLYILDRTNGKPLIGIDERPVPQEPRMKTARTQPFPIGDPFVPLCGDPNPADYLTGCLFATYYDKPVLIRPSNGGGNVYSPPTFSPKTNLVYVPGSVLNSAFEFRRQVWNEEKKRWDTTGSGSGRYRPAGVVRSGTLTAMDPTTNKIVWQKTMKYPMGGGNGLLSTASGLLFHGDSDGHVVAVDIKSGNPLWKFQTGAGANAPPITYEVDGQQYIAIVAGGNQVMMSKSGDSLWAFRLGGSVPEAPAPPPPPEVQPAGTRPDAN